MNTNLLDAHARMVIFFINPNMEVYYGYRFQHVL